MIKKLEENVDKFQQQLNAIRSEKVITENQLKEFNNLLKLATVELNKLELIYNSFDDQIQDYQLKHNRLLNEMTLTSVEKTEINELNEKLIQFDKEILIVSPNLQILQQEVANLQHQIHDVGGPRLAKAQSRLNILSDQSDKLNHTLQSFEIEEINSSKLLNKCQIANEKNSIENEKVLIKLEKLEKEQKDMEQDALLVITAVEEAKTLMAEKEEQVELLLKQYNEIKITVTKIKNVEIDLQSEIERINKEMSENVNSQKLWNDKLIEIQTEYSNEQMEFNTAVNAILPENERINTFDVLPILSEEELQEVINDTETIKREINHLEKEKER